MSRPEQFSTVEPVLPGTWAEPARSFENYRPAFQFDPERRGATEWSSETYLMDKNPVNAASIGSGVSLIW